MPVMIHIILCQYNDKPQTLPDVHKVWAEVEPWQLVAEWWSHSLNGKCYLHWEFPQDDQWCQILRSLVHLDMSWSAERLHHLVTRLVCSSTKLCLCLPVSCKTHTVAKSVHGSYQLHVAGERLNGPRQKDVLCRNNSAPGHSLHNVLAQRICNGFQLRWVIVFVTT